MHRLSVGITLLISFWMSAWSCPMQGAYTDPTLSVKTVSSASNTNQPIVTLGTGTATTVTLIVTATNFTPTSYTWSQVTDTFNSFASSGTAGFSATQTSMPQVTVTLQSAGVYQFQVVASDGVASASRYVWVNVWDHVSALNPNHQVGRNPDIAAPTSIRQLSRDPGPYCHPRVLFSRSDWAELSQKATSSNDVITAINSMKSSLAANFDQSGGALNSLASVYSAYAQGGYTSSYYTNTMLLAYATGTAQGIINGSLMGANPGSAFFDGLLVASYLAWIGTDPTLNHASVSGTAQARFNYLASLLASSAKVELAVNGNSNAFYNLALSYDLLYDWMTPQQQADTRDYLYAIGYGLYNTGGGGLSQSPWDGHLQNGDFPNLADGIILAALAIEGEEASVSGTVQSGYGPTLSYAAGPTAWPCASPASVSNLHRQMNWNTDWFVTPWGFKMNMEDYFQLGQNITAPGALALARRGEDQFVTTNYYQSSLAALYNLAPRESDHSMALFDHHDGMGFTPGPGQMNAAYIVKYMYPDDPMVDYVYRAFRAENINPLAQAIFGSEPGTQPLASVAQSKSLALTKFDPQRAVAVSRNGWNENDLNLIFENRFDFDGHMHAERNNFSLYALGRAWSSPPGYHCTTNDLQATVLIQNPALAADPATAGYIGQSPSSATQTGSTSYSPTPPGKLVEITEDPSKQWTLFAGDASPAYNCGYTAATGTSIDTGVKTSSYMYDGLLPNLAPSIQTSMDSDVTVNQVNYNPVQYAIRSILTVRGSSPYVLVIDDIQKDASPHNYRWSMPCAVSFGGSGGRFVDASNNSIFSSLAIQSGATATDAILYHSPIDDPKTQGQTGLPRLLVRDVSEQSTTGQPAIFLDNRPANFAGGNLTYGWDNNFKAYTTVPSNRLMIERDGVVAPAYKVLLFPYLTGSSTPVTSWDATKTILTIDQQNGTIDKITFDTSHADHRTRVAGFSRSKGHPAPTLHLPGNLVVAANGIAANGQPGGSASFIVTGTDYLGNSITPVLSSTSGTIFPVGYNTVTASVMDSAGQITSGTFGVAVIPSAPAVTVTSISNIATSGSGYGISLSWPIFYGATGYNVKRATVSGGPYTVVSSNQNETAFTDSNLATPGYYYIVTALLDSYEGAASNEVALPPASGNLTAQGLGTAFGDGAYPMGNSYLVTCSQGDMGGYSDQCTFLSKPWTGDGSFTARIASVSAQGGALSQFCKIGVMMRSISTPNAPFAMAGYNTYVSPILFIYRALAGALGSGTSLFNYSSVSTPIWCRLIRSGTMFSASYSFDGSNWNATGTSAGVGVSTNALVGLAVSPQNNVSTSALFDNVVFMGTPVVAATSPTSATLSWAGAQASSYRVQRGTSPGGPFQTVASGLTSATYTDITGSLGTFYYTVTAYSEQGSPTLSPVVMALIVPPPGLPGNLAVTPGFSTNALSWSPSTGATSYTVKRATAHGGPYAVIASGLATTNYTDTALLTGVSYYYVVTGVNSSGESSASAESSGVPVSGTATKANNATDLDLGGSWSTGAVPTAADHALWNGTYTTGSVSVGSGLAVQQLQITSPSQAITINPGTGSLNPGSGGIEMSTATQSLTINAPVCLAASQSWPVAAAQSLYLNNGVSDAGAAFGLNFTGSGSIVLAANNNYTGPTNLSAGTLHIGAPAGTTTGSIAGSLNLTGGTLRSNRTDVHAPIGGVLTASAGVIQVNAATGVLTLNATNLPAASSNAFTTLTGNGGATFAVDAAPTASLSFGGSVAGLNLAIKNGAVAFTTNGGACNFLIQGGSFTAPPTDRFQLATANQTFIVTGGTANLTSGATYGFRFGGGGSPSQSGAQLVTGTQSGGTVSVAGFNMGGTDTSPTKSPSYALSGGTLTTTGGMILGADTGGTGSSTFALSGGKLKVPGSISGAQAGAKQVFALTGGTLVAATFAATNLRADVASANGTLTQSGGTLAPGDIGTAGKTAITGNYNLGAAGTLAIDLGGTTQATAFQTGQYDYVTVSGSTTLLGSLSVTIGNGFTPTNAQTFTVLNSTGAVSGSFANVAFGGRVVATDGKSSFIVSLSTNQVTLSGYVPLPDVPANLTATGGVGQIVLTWSPAANASTYSVKISATSGGPYSLLASGLASTGYIQTGLAPSQSCYYVVSGSNAAAQSPDSSETNATTATALQAWRWTNFGTVSGTGTASNTADPDHDGVANLLEYAMGTNPNSAASNGMPTLGTAAGKLTLTFTRARSDTTYTVEASSDLISWSTLATNPGTVGQSVTVSDSVNISASNPPHRFLRLRVLTP